MPKISYKYNVQMNPKLTRDGANAFTHKTSNLICFPRCSLSMQIYGCIAGSRLLLAAPRMTVRRRQCPPDRHHSYHRTRRHVPPCRRDA